MDVKKIKIKFSKIKYGWIGITIKIDNKKLVFINGTGVFNPFYNYGEMLYILKNTEDDYIWEIEEEGPETHISFRSENKVILITVEKLCRKDDKYWIAKQTFAVSRSQLIKEFKEKILKMKRNNKKNIKDNFYNFSFNERLIKDI